MKNVERLSAPDRKRCSAAVLAALIALSPSSPLFAQTSPRIPGNALPSGPAIINGVTQLPNVTGRNTLFQPQIVSGQFNPYQVNGNTATITQTTNAGILRWGSFDIGSDATVNIMQPNSTAVLLNKVDGGLLQKVREQERVKARCYNDVGTRQLHH